MAQEQNIDRSKEAYVAQTGQFYIHDFKGISKSRTQIPFYIYMVNEEGQPESIPWPPLINGSVNNPNQVLGIKLMINPSTLSLNMAKIINRTQTMVGWIEDHWGEELDTITLQGSSAAFVLGATDVRGLTLRRILGSQLTNPRTQLNDFYSYIGIQDQELRAGNEGLTVKFRRDTLSYREFKALTRFFAANGCLFDDRGFISKRNYIRLTYDYSSYLGYFESLDIVEESIDPYKFTYTITFKVEKTEYSFPTRNRIRDV